MEDCNGGNLPNNIWEGELLMDTANNQWRLGKLIDDGGFGEVYLASSNIYEPVNSDAQYIVKLEPYDNGSLTTEINCYRRMAESAMMDEWKVSRNLKHLGLSRYMGSGSRVYTHQKYIFLVLERHGQDLERLFAESGRFPVKTVCYLGIQILDILEYIHNHGYVHADIKAPNLLLGNSKDKENCVHLINFGLARRYLYGHGVHNMYVHDEHKAHTGTLRYLSRDAHVGTFSRRGDLESLGYNMLQWLCGTLPWQDKQVSQYNYYQKKNFMFNMKLLIRRCFPTSEPPGMLIQYLEYVANLDFETEPNYAYCRNLLKQAIEDSGSVDDGRFVFGEGPFATSAKCSNRGRKRRATVEPEIAAKQQPKSRLRHTPEATEIIIKSRTPHGEMTRYEDLKLKFPTTIRAKYDPVVLLERLPNEVLQKFTGFSPRVSKPTKYSHQKAQTLSSSSFNTSKRSTLKIRSTTRHETSPPADRRCRGSRVGTRNTEDKGTHGTEP
jgi:vaccinia related kinase